MARHCVKWASSRKSSKRRRGRGKQHCRHGVVKRGRRKGHCLKHKRSKR